MKEILHFLVLLLLLFLQNKGVKSKVWPSNAGLPEERAACSDPIAAGETQGLMGSGFPSKQLVKQSQGPDALTKHMVIHP